MYFSCIKDPQYENPLHKVATTGAGESLKKTVKSNDNTLKVKLGRAIDPADAHAIDIQYHLKCWNTHVSNLLRGSHVGTDNSRNISDEIAAEIEIISLLKKSHMQGQILPMSFLLDMYIHIHTICK